LLLFFAIKDRAPHLFNDSIGYDRCRVSFVGHSLGGLIIRLALQNEDLTVLKSKLHLFVTLASPHVGNLFSDSQLVSTGEYVVVFVLL
jgi:alpha-beta hydrolase superfamily lysophospholipase